MSSPGAASDHSPTGSEVTPATAAAEAHHHAASPPSVRCSSQPERHQRIPSPTGHAHDDQGRNSVPPVSAPPSLKRARTVPSSSNRPYSSFHPQSPQLSERDSIFATHYLPEDSSDATGTSSPSDHSPSQEPVRSPQLTASSPDDPKPPTASARSSVSEPSSLEPSVAPSPHPAFVDDAVQLARTTGPHPGYLRGATDVLPGASGVSLGGSHVGWVRQQESVESSKVAGTHRIAIRETFHPLRKTASDDNGSQGVDPETTLGDHPHPGHVPLMRPSLGEPWPAAAHSRNQGNGIVDAKLDLHPSRGRSARVEESIEANLTHTEPAAHVRSRKSSHYLGLFKENTSPDRKRREERERALEKIRSAQEDGAELDDAQQTPRPTKATLQTQPAADVESDRRTVRIDAADDDLAHQRQTLPRNLLEEIRNFHLTTGGSRGGSFSQSIPTKFDEQPQRQVLRSPIGSPPSSDSRDRPDSAPEEDDDEHISSALYFPHEPSTVERGEAFPGFPGQEVHPHAAEIPAGHDMDRVDRGHVDISLLSRRDSSIFRGDYKPVTDTDARTLGTTTPEYSHESTSESEFVSADESASTHDEVSSLTDDADLTPKATPTQTYRPRRKHAKVAPVGAVELKPYRHQVGGHTTVFRFSRRAVCKQLNNRENEFYERIEKRHPELLIFLPRYVAAAIVMLLQIG